MPLVSSSSHHPGTDQRQSERAMDVRSGLIRGLEERNWSFVPEFTLANGRRADLMALDEKGTLIVFEIKSSIEDFRADTKWHEYKAYCDAFFFATLPDVPIEIFPQTEGLVLADRHGCDIIRDADHNKLAPATRKAITLKFARAAASRLLRYTLHEANFRGE